jgi:hypothetical protein
MIIINKINIFPIIIETDQYVDRFGNQNSYVEMNPSLYIKKDGSFTVLVRTVNYLKYKNKKFTVYENSSNSVYYIMRGKMDNGRMNLDTCEVSKLNVEYDIPRYYSYWYGLEDIRFIDENSILACIPECNNSSPCIFKGILINNVITSFEKCNPAIIEKNWMPYSDKSVIYSVSPFIIKNIKEDNKEEIMVNENVLNELNGWHGSSNGIDFEGEKLFLIHKNEERVINRWLLFNPIEKTIKYSNVFVFFRDSYFEFTCSLAEYDDRIFASVGVNDNRAYIVEISKHDIIKLF